MTPGEGPGPEAGAEPAVAAAAGCVLHATTVAVEGRGLLILGPSGSGKSGLALALMALGAVLVADDRTVLCRRGGMVYASAPPALAGLIEARGLGILHAPALPEAALALAVDLGQLEPARLPPPRRIRLLGLTLPLVQKSATDHFPAAVLHYLRHGRSDQR